MNKNVEWIEDVFAQNNEEVIKTCGRGCAKRSGAVEVFIKLGEEDSYCKSIAEYVSFLNNHLPLKFEEVEDNVLIHFNKKECSCPISKFLTKNSEKLCICTNGHEEYC